MKKKLLSTILIMVMLFTTAVMSLPEVVFADSTTEVTGGTDPADEKTAYLTFDVKAPKGSVVIVESIQYNGQGYIDTVSGNTGEFGGSKNDIFSDGVEAFFMKDPRLTLDIGNYYYKITEKDLGVENVTYNYENKEYIVWMYIDYKTNEAGEYLDKNDKVVASSAQADKRMSIVLMDGDDHEKPLGMEFKNCLEETIEIKRVIDYTEFKTREEGGEQGACVDPVVETVTLKRRVLCDSEGNPIKADGTPATKDSEKVVLGENDKPLVYVDKNGNIVTDPSKGTPVLGDGKGQPELKNGKTQPTTVWHVDEVKPSDRKKDSIKEDATKGTAVVTKPLTSPNHPDDEEYKNWYPDVAVVDGWEIDLNNPEDAFVPVVYRPRNKVEEITITRTITYTELTEDGKEVAGDHIQTVTLRRIVELDENCNPKPFDGEWEIVPEKSDIGSVTSPGHPKKDEEGWKPNKPVVEVWDVDLKNPKDVIVHVVYTPKDKPEPPVVEEEIITIKRIITYTEYEYPGKEVEDNHEQIVKIRRIKTTYPNGRVEITGWEIIPEESDQSAVTSPDHKKKKEEGWHPDQDVVGKWEIDLTDPKDAVVHVIYEPIPPTEEEDTLTITRVITYTEYDENGKEVAKTKKQVVKLKRTKSTYPDGRVEYGKWEIVPEESDQSAVVSPDHQKKDEEGWKPDIDEVGFWDIDLDDPKSEIIHVIYTPETPEPGENEETEEFLTITRTITYTEHTPDGKEVSKTITQTVILRRKVLKDKDGNIIEIGRWEIYSGDTDSVKTPGKDGWTPDKSSIPPWEIDLDNPQSEIIHVVYVPTENIKTGDENNLLLWGGILGGAVIAILLLFLKKRKKDDEQ